MDQRQRLGSAEESKFYFMSLIEDNSETFEWRYACSDYLKFRTQFIFFNLSGAELFLYYSLQHFMSSSLAVSEYQFFTHFLFRKFRAVRDVRLMKWKNQISHKNCPEKSVLSVDFANSHQRMQFSLEEQEHFQRKKI